MIVVKVIGGLGNQLFQVAYALQLSSRFNKKIYIDLNSYDTYKIRSYKIRDFCVDDFLNYPTIESSLPIPKRIIFAQKFYRIVQKLIKVLFTKSNFEQFYFRYFSNFGLHFNFDNFYHEHDLTSECIFVYGYFQSEKYFIESRDLIRNLFLTKNFDAISTSKLGKLISKSNSLAVSMRLGDDYMNSKEHFVCDEDYFLRALNRFNLDEVSVFVFSDEIDRAKSILKKLNVNIKSLTFVDGYSESESLMLMALCKNFVLSNSSFSWWGAYLSQSSDKRVIVPLKWYAYKSDKVDIYLDSMELI